MNPNRHTLLPLAASAGLALVASPASAMTTTLLFYDSFGVGGSLTDPAARATGTLASTVKYAWTSTTDVAISGGILTWDGNNNRNGQNQQTDTTAQHFRMTYNWAPQVAGTIWEVEFDQRVAWNHPLTFGLSDNTQNGIYNAWNNSSYDFAVSSFGTGLFYDTDNDDGGTGNTNTSQVTNVFRTLVAANPATDLMHHFRIRFDEVNGMVTIWINGEQKAQSGNLDFENAGRYLSWGEATNYAGALDNLSVSIVPEPASFVLLGFGGIVMLRRKRD